MTGLPERWRAAPGLVGAAALLLGLGSWAPAGPWRLGALAAALTLLTVAGAVALSDTVRRWSGRVRGRALADLLSRERGVVALADGAGAVRLASPAARKRIEAAPHSSIDVILAEFVADPSAVRRRLQARAAALGGAEESQELAGRSACVSVVHLGGSEFLWRIHPGDGAPVQPVAPVPDSLAVLSVGAEGEVLSASPAAVRLLGGRPVRVDEVALERPLQPGVPNRLRTAEGVRLCHTLELGRTGERVDYALLPLSGPEIPSDQGNPVAFDALPVPLMRLHHDGTVLRVNAQAARLLGRDDAEGRSIEDLVEGLGRPISDWLQQALAGRAPHHSEFLRIRRDDREAFVQVTLRPMAGASDSSLIAVLNDATEFKTLEAQFVQSQKMQAVGQLAGGVAHDFNNLLTAISGHCDLLMLRHDQGDPDYADLEQIRRNVSRASALVSQLLAFSRKQTLRPELLDVGDALADLAYLLNRLVGEKVRLVFTRGPTGLNIRADRRQLEQVIMNLVVNARDAMPEGGKVEIHTAEVHLDQPFPRERTTIPAGRYVSIKVADEGHGIPADKRQKVFEPFFTTKRTGEGTGLGLSTVYGIVKQTGGYIFLDSEVGRGTTFELLFPLHAAADDAGRQPADSEARKRKKGRRGGGVILLVEDEAPVRAFSSRALQMYGYTVLEAGSAEEALQILEDPALSVDLFVSDVVMPGLDGPGWVRRAREQRPEVPVIFVSGYAESAVARELELPRATFLPKPFSLGELTEAVARQLG